VKARIVDPGEPQIRNGEEYVTLRYEHGGKTADFPVKKSTVEAEGLDALAELYLPKAKLVLMESLRGTTRRAPTDEPGT
jgi:hypothetical protein